MRRTKQDAVFSDLVRERANWTCEVCGKYYPEGSRGGLECSHFYSRSRNSTRLHPLNAAAQCTHCHFQLGGDPVLFTEWINQHLKKGEPEYLRFLANKIQKKPKWYKEEEYQHLKKELARMRKLRLEGETGRIEFTAYGED